MRHLLQLLAVSFISGFVVTALAAESSASSNSRSDKVEHPDNPVAAPAVATDPSYRLSPGDTIAVSVYNEPDMSDVKTIGRSGDVRLPMIDKEIILTGKTVREAERFLEQTYRDRKLLKTPVVGITVTAYSPREIAILGAVKSPGSVSFPRDLTSMDVVEVITKAGGFTPVAKTWAVQIIHRTAEGKEDTQVRDLSDMVTGKRKVGRDRIDFPIYPGDRIFVPETLF